MQRLGLFIAVVLVLAALVGVWALGAGMEHRIIPGVWVWDVAVGGMEPEAARPYLETGLGLRHPNIVLVGPEGQRWAFSPADLGMAVDTEATLARAFAPGRAEEMTQAWRERIDILLEGRRLSPVLTWNPQPAHVRLSAIAAEIDRAAVDAGVTLRGAELRLDAGGLGRRVEVTETLELLLPALHALEPIERALVITELPPRVTDEAASQALGTAEAILSRPLQLLVSDPREGDPGPWTLSPEVMAGMLRIRVAEEQILVALDEAALADTLGPLAMALYREPQNAAFEFDPDTMTLSPIRPSVVGREVDVAASIERINTRLQTGEHFVPLVTRETLPELLDTVSAEDLGIREVIAVGESYFTGSSSARDRNIRLGASKFDGVLIAPGETFSFNEHLGEVSPDAGYDQSFVIIGNRTVQGVGGGICQVSTTAFRAAFYAGYPIVERWPHAYRVGFYELGGFGPGFDATIYSPIVDFRFVNDTEHYLLIQTEVDAARARTRFIFYSTDTDREVEQIGPTWGERIPPGPPVYEYNPDLAAGALVQVENPVQGLNARLGRIVRDAEGQILHEDTFISNFVPWPARYQYGPGFVPPPNAEVITPEP